MYDLSVFVCIDPLPFPNQLSSYGLRHCFVNVQSEAMSRLGWDSVCWRMLHEFLKKCEKKTRTSTKTPIYIAGTGERHIQVYWANSAPLLSYNIADVHLQAEVHNFCELVHNLASQVAQQQGELELQHLAELTHEGIKWFWWAVRSFVVRVLWVEGRANNYLSFVLCTYPWLYYCVKNNLHHGQISTKM